VKDESHIVRIRIHHRFEVACVYSLELSNHDLHVLLRHSLLRKPGGFESLRMARVEEHAQQRAAPHLTYPSERVLHLGATDPASEADGAENENFALNIPHVLRKNLVELEVSVDLSPPLPHAFVAAIGLPALVQSGVFGPDLDLRVRVLDPIVDVAPIPALKGLADDIDVLLRHRLLPQPGGLESLRSVAKPVHSDDQTVPKCVEVGELGVDLNAISAAYAPVLDREDSAVGKLDGPHASST
jgi:hypothetical protein